MPYINPESRERLAHTVMHLEYEAQTATLGDLNYLITKLVRAWIAEPSYSKLASATGVLENVKQELYRRLASPYEDKKIAENGDVYC